MKIGAKNTGGYSVTVSLCHRATWKRNLYAGRTNSLSEPRENAIYRESRNE